MLGGLFVMCDAHRRPDDNIVSKTDQDSKSPAVRVEQEICTS